MQPASLKLPLSLLPAQSHLIAAAVAKQNPSKAVSIARTVSAVLPGNELLITYYVSQIEPQVALGLSAELQAALSYLGQDAGLGFDYSAGASAFSSSVANSGFKGQVTIAQAEAAELMFQVLSKTPVSERAGVKAQLDLLLAPANRLKLSDIRALSQGGSVILPGGGTASLSSVLIAAGSSTNSTTVQLSANEVSGAGSTAVTQVQMALVSYVKQIALNPNLTAAAKTAAIKKLAPSAGDAGIQAIIDATPDQLDAVIADNATAAINLNVISTGGLAIIASTTIVVRVVTDAYGAL